MANLIPDTPSVLTWSEQLATGLPEIDQQHRALIEIINTLGTLRARGAATEELRAVFDKLHDYTVYHFREEEAMMAAWPVDPERKAAHLRAHHRFIERIEKAGELIPTNPLDVTDHLLAFLVKWLIHHISGVDARLAKEILALRSGEPMQPDTNEENRQRNALIDIISDLYDSIGARTLEVLELNRCLHDEIEQRQRVERDLIAARDAATASARAKSEFLANMSHEIRTPLNGVLGMIELARGTELTPEQREYMDYAHSSADALLVIVSDLLDFAKSEAHKLTLELRPFDLRTMLHDTAGPLALRARQKGLDLSVEVDPRIPCRIVGDMARLRQIILNLAGNALKFTERGGIGIGATLERDDVDGVLVRFAVTDTGIGIAADKIEEIFEPFTQADASISRQYGGTGLGLAICGMLVKLMRGRIWAESTPEQGSTFFFDALFGHAAADDAAEAPTMDDTAPMHGTRRALRVLLVEDNQVNQKFALTILAKAGHQATLAGNGQAAVDLARVQRFDVILMDIQMPGMDGFTATRLIRQLGIDTPIIAMTAHAMAEFHEALALAGMDDYLPKPVQARQLLDKLDALGRTTSATPVSPVATAAPAMDGALPIIDREGALRIVDGDIEHLKLLAQLVLEQIDAELPLIRLQVAALDTAELKVFTHRLKGTLGSMAALAACEACTSLEDFARAADSAAYNTAFAHLEKELDRLRPVLHQLAAGTFVEHD